MTPSGGQGIVSQLNISRVYGNLIWKNETSSVLWLKHDITQKSAQKSRQLKYLLAPSSFHQDLQSSMNVTGKLVLFPWIGKSTKYFAIFMN